MKQIFTMLMASLLALAVPAQDTPAMREHLIFLFGDGNSLVLSRGTIPTLGHVWKPSARTIPQVTNGAFWFRSPDIQEAAQMNDGAGFALKFKHDAAAQPLEMMYLQPRAMWQPSYRIEQLSSRKAKLTIVAHVTAMKPLVAPEVCFVMGPLDASKLVGSPMMEPFLTAIGIGSSDKLWTVQAIQDAAIYNGLQPQTWHGRYSDSSFLANLEVLHLKNMHLDQGKSGVFTLLSSDIPAEEVIEFELHDGDGLMRNPFTGQKAPYDMKSGDVYRSLKLDNHTSVPWVSAPLSALLSVEGVDLKQMQTTMSKTAPGKQTFIRIEKVPDIEVQQTIKTVDRRQEAGTDSDLLTLECTITVRYRGNAPQKLILHGIHGNLGESSLEADLSSAAQVKWVINLKPNSEQTFTFTYTKRAP